MNFNYYYFKLNTNDFQSTPIKRISIFPIVNHNVSINIERNDFSIWLKSKSTDATVHLKILTKKVAVEYVKIMILNKKWLRIFGY